MAKVVLSKSGLQRERNNLALYRKVLPSLDLKRRQLLGEQKRAEHALEVLRKELEAFPRRVAHELPMLGADAVDLKPLLKVRRVRTGVENVVGVKLPVLEEVEFDAHDYSLLSNPHWVDPVLKRLREFAELKARFEIAEERVRLVRHAARKVTQRVNLFEKILIPTAQKNIKKIQIHLADHERAMVVQSKIAKSRGRRDSRALRAEEAEVS